MSENQILQRIREDWTVNTVRALQAENQLPFFRAMQTANSTRVDIEGQSRLMLGSNNYLGLADHPKVTEGARKALERFGTGSTGSRLLNGTIELHLELEAEIADWYGTEAAIVFTTGHQANLGTIGTLVGRGDVLVADHSAHASIHDAAKFTDAQRIRFRHNDADSLREKLITASNQGRPALVAIDGVYSMEGDLAPVGAIAEVCREYGALLLVDEAHSLGLFGAGRTGVTELYGETAPLRTGTFSKSIASTGGFVAASRDYIDSIRIHGRAFLFTASGVPAAVGAALAAVRLIRSAEGRERAERCLGNARFLRDSLVALGVQMPEVSKMPDGSEIVTPIVPVVVGESLRAATKWNELFERGVFTGMAHYPAVPHDGALLRLAVTAEHSFVELEEAAEVIHKVLADEHQLVA